MACGPVTEPRVPGRVGSCRDCGAEIWISDESWTYAVSLNPDMVALCMRCTYAVAGVDGEVEFRLSPLSRAIASLFGRRN